MPQLIHRPLVRIFALLHLWFIMTCLGVGMAALCGIPQGYAVGLSLAIGVVGPWAAICRFRKFDTRTRDQIDRALHVLWYVEVGIIFGGMPGAVIGHAIADDPGEMIGWFVSAAVSGVIAGIWAWRALSRFIV